MDYVNKSRPMWSEVRQNVTYVDPPPSPRHDVLVVEDDRRRIVNRSPPPRYHSPTERIVKVEPERPYYNDGRMSNRYNQRNYNNNYHQQPNYGTTRSLSNRRCCTAAIAALLLLGLAGLAVGLYFAITSAQASATANLPQNKVLNGYKGYYVNGVYVVPVTTKPSETYLIIGADMPCNKYNNNSAVTPSIYYPNCQDITTSIVKSNWTTTTTVTPVIMYSGAGGVGAAGSAAAAFFVGAVGAVLAAVVSL